MSEQEQDQKTEPPSAKRLEEARESGQLALSRETATWVAMMGVLVVVWLSAPSVMREFYEFLRGFIESSHAISVNENNVQNLLFYVYSRGTMIGGVMFLLLVCFIIAGYMGQTGFFFSLDLMTPDIERLSPMRGFHRLFSLNSLVELVKSMAKFLFLGGIAYVVLAPIMDESPSFTGFPIENILTFVHKKTIRLIEMILLVFAVIAAADLFYQRFQFIRGLRMTKAEVKEEYRQQEGDPLIKGRLRQLRVEKARRRMMAQVPKADVVITNPTHYAVALQYELGKMSAPTVVAKGINLIAERIREIAEENHVPLVSNPPLARALYSTVEIDQPIPGEHYRAVAEIISYVYKLKKKRLP
jgi:flagellar biosynthetic protein FlhB